MSQEKVFQVRSEPHFKFWEVTQEEQEKLVNVLGWEGRVLFTQPDKQAETLEAERDCNERMFIDACEALGLINEKLGLDPDDGGAEPILDAIDELRAERDKWVDAGHAVAAETANLEAELRVARASLNAPPVTLKAIEEIKDLMLWPVTEDDARTARDALQSLHFDLSMNIDDTATPPAIEAPQALSDSDVQWIVNDNAELGVKIGHQFFFLYKGNSLVYESGLHDDGRPLMYRPVFKREFGECAHPINYDDYSKIGTVSLSDSDEWKAISAAVHPAAAPAVQVQSNHACRLTDDELADTEFVRAYIESQNESFATLMAAQAQPVAIARVREILDGIDRDELEPPKGGWCQTSVGADFGAKKLAELEAYLIGAQPVADPMDWPLPCDVTVGNGTHKKGVPLRSLVARMNVLHGMAKSQPVADAAQLRAAGRAEAMAILMRLDPETGIDDYTGWSKSGAPEDEGSAYWKEDKLRELFSVDDSLADMMDKAEAEYWHYKGLQSEAERAHNFAANMHNSGKVRAVLAKHGEYDLMADLCQPPADAAAVEVKPVLADQPDIEFRKCLRAFAMTVAEEGIKEGRGRTMSVASDRCRAVVDGVMGWEIGKGLIYDLLLAAQRALAAKPAE